MKQKKTKKFRLVTAAIMLSWACMVLICIFFFSSSAVVNNQGKSGKDDISKEIKKPDLGKKEKDELILKEINAETPKLRQMIKEGNFNGAEIRAKELLDKGYKTPELDNIYFSSRNLTEYNGTIEHIFFHPLIAYPERAFKSQGQDMFMVTVYEFKKIIEEVYKRGYILVDLADIFNVSCDETGRVVNVTKNKLMLPEGKKPLVISVDDLNYYEYMIRDGQVSSLVLDKNGEVETYSKDMKGKDVYSKDNEIVPILDEFVKRHPDFSFNGAKGTINLTGYEGVLGYRTNSLRYNNFESERMKALKVIDRLKKTGWSFASHSQGHRHFKEVSYRLIVEDTDRFEAEVKPLIGNTFLFVYPYGEQVPPSDPKFQYLQSKGFGVFCGVSKYPNITMGQGYAIMSRRNVDGIALKDNRHSVLYEASKVCDPVRPWYNEYYGNKEVISNP